YAVSLESGTITWSAEMDGRVDSAVAVADGQVVAVARNTDTAQVVVAAFARARGGRSGPALAIQANSTAGTAASAGGGSLFIGSADRRVRALDAADGTERWATLVLSLFSPATALAFDDQSVFAADIAGGLYRLDAADGGRAWSYQLNEVALRSSPVVSGDSVLLGLGDGRLVAIDVASGHLVWESDASPGLVGTIALASDAVIAVKGGRDAGLIAFEHDPEGTLIDVPSPTQLDAGTTLTRWALAAVIVFAVAFVPGLWAKRRFGVAAQGEAGDVSDPDAETEGGSWAGRSDGARTGLGRHRSRPDRPRSRSSPPRRPNRGARSAAPCSVRPVSPSARPAGGGSGAACSRSSPRPSCSRSRSWCRCSRGSLCTRSGSRVGLRCWSTSSLCRRSRPTSTWGPARACWGSGRRS